MTRGLTTKNPRFNSDSKRAFEPMSRDSNLTHVRKLLCIVWAGNIKHILTIVAYIVPNQQVNRVQFYLIIQIIILVLNQHCITVSFINYQGSK